jgi:imidazolonepropionase-like amidohydrolase
MSGGKVRFRYLLALLICPWTAFWTEAQSVSSATAVIRHVNIVDVETGALLQDRDVVLGGDHILSLSPAEISHAYGSAEVIDGRGKYLIPGLWDCHIHLSWITPSALPLLTALGITDVRDLGGKLTDLEKWRAQIADGTLVGPNIMRVGPILNGKSFNQYQFVPGSAEATRGAVRLLTFLGMDEIKVHRRLPRDWYFAALDESKKLNIRVVGHIPMEVTPEEASNAGQYMIEHTETLFEGTFSAKLTDAELPAAIHAWLATDQPDQLFATFVRNGTWVDPTLSGYLETANQVDPETPHDPRYKYVAASQLKLATDQLKQHPFTAADIKTMHDHMNALVDVTARMVKDHVRLLAGTDAAGPRLAGFSLHEELVDLVRAGMTPLQALQTATLNPAVAFDRKADLGTIAPGKLADLVLLEANPLEHIENTQGIDAVFEHGRVYRRKDLDALLAKAERLAAAN